MTDHARAPVTPTVVCHGPAVVRTSPHGGCGKTVDRPRAPTAAADRLRSTSSPTVPTGAGSAPRTETNTRPETERRSEHPVSREAGPAQTLASEAATLRVLDLAVTRVIGPPGAYDVFLRLLSASVAVGQGDGRAVGGDRTRSLLGGTEACFRLHLDRAGS
jgi:hypothetical protein